MLVSKNMIYGRGASFNSILQDMADIEECNRKERMPKSSAICNGLVGHIVNSCMTVIII